MTIEQIYTGCLAQGAYYIESEGEAAVIDPLRDPQPYLQKALDRKAKIKYVFETHFHADFVSGHVDLAKASGAQIVYGPTQIKTGFEALIAKEGQIFNIGKLKLEVLHTPGHTMESACYLLYDDDGKPHSLFTGDTLFIGDVGRPDLAQHVIAELTQEKLAGHLFDSLRNKIMPLPDHLIVYPGHGAGSACGKKMSSETQDTLGHQKAGNYALRPDLTKEEFVREVLDGLTQPPSYFPKNVLMNMKGYKSFEEVMQQGISALNPLEFKSIALAKGALIVDTRHPDVFRKEFIPGSINIGLDGNFAVWAGTLIPDIEQPILIVAEEGREKEVVSRLSRVGYDHTIGYLKGGIEAWKNSGLETDFIASVSAAEFSKTALELPETSVLDVRRKAEFEAGHLTNASNIPLDYINQNMEKIERNKPVFVHCAGGYRSVIFISILQARGFRNFINVEGGFLSIQSVGKLKSVTEKVEVV